MADSQLSKKATQRKGMAFLVFFGLFWSAITLAFDVFIFTAAARQLMALNYPATQGTILTSEVTLHQDSEGSTTHNVSVRYAYAVGDQEYTATRYRYGSFNSSDGKWARSLVANLSPGTSVKVFYNPRNPDDAVLFTGLSGSDLFMFAFMTPFNTVMLGLWWACGLNLSRQWTKSIAGGVKIIPGLRQARIRLADWSEIAAGLATMAVLSFISIFPIAFFGGGFHPSMTTMLLTWLFILAGGFTAWGWQLNNRLSGKYDLVIDEIGGALDLPATNGRKTRRRILISDIESVYVDTIQKRIKSEDGASTAYAPTLRIRGGTPTTEQLAQWTDQTKADDFTEWLRGTICD
jgi:hypothetical protein